MLRNAIANAVARLARAVAARIADDMALASKFQACWSSAALASDMMQEARACRTQLDVMQAALAASTLDGFVAEFGVYKGATLRVIGRHFSNQPVHGFDTFTGLPGFWRKGFTQGTFATMPGDIIVPSNCVLHKGLFDDTLPRFLSETTGNAKFIHIDCDMYDSATSVFHHLADRIESKTVILFDEYFNYNGWQKHEYKAFDEYKNKNNRQFKCIAYNERGQQAAFIAL